jgi:quinoprotein glucose dehydrogenase
MRRHFAGHFDVSIGDQSWPCQKPPWGSLIAIDASTGDIVWRTPLGITAQLPAGRQNTGRPVLAGPIVTAGGLLFIASTDDNRFRAFDAKTGRELWVTTLERRGNADPITYQGRDGSQYVAIVDRHPQGLRAALTRDRPEIRMMDACGVHLRLCWRRFRGPRS